MLIDTSIRPGEHELGGFEYAWDLDNDNEYDDGFGPEFRWNPTSEGTHSIGLQISNEAGSDTIHQDITVIPEPSTYALGLSLFAAGAAGIRARLRMKRLLKSNKPFDWYERL